MAWIAQSHLKYISPGFEFIVSVPERVSGCLLAFVIGLLCVAHLHVIFFSDVQVTGNYKWMQMQPIAALHQPWPYLCPVREVVPIRAPFCQSRYPIRSWRIKIDVGVPIQNLLYLCNCIFNFHWYRVWPFSPRSLSLSLHHVDLRSPKGLGVM